MAEWIEARDVDNDALYINMDQAVCIERLSDNMIRVNFSDRTWMELKGNRRQDLIGARIIQRGRNR